MKEIIVRVSEQVHAAMMDMQRPDCNNVRIDIFGAFLDNIRLQPIKVGEDNAQIVRCDAVFHAWAVAKPSALQEIEGADEQFEQMRASHQMMRQERADQMQAMGGEPDKDPGEA